MKELLESKTRDELIEMIEQLSMECDERHAHEDVLETQLREAGIKPQSHTFLNPPFDLPFEDSDQIEFSCATSHE